MTTIHRPAHATLTRPQRLELARQRDRGPQTTYGSARTRVQNTLVALGLSEFINDAGAATSGAYIGGGFREWTNDFPSLCRITAAGTRALDAKGVALTPSRSRRIKLTPSRTPRISPDVVAQALGAELCVRPERASPPTLLFGTRGTVEVRLLGASARLSVNGIVVAEWPPPNTMLPVEYAQEAARCLLQALTGKKPTDV